MVAEFAYDPKANAYVYEYYCHTQSILEKSILEGTSSIDAIGSALRVPRNEVSQVGVIELIGPPPPRPLYSVEECLVKEQPNSPVKLSLTGGSWCPHCQGLGFDFHFVNLI